MSTPRTVTVPTIDHGPITLDCPAWCTGHDTERPGLRIELSHVSPDIPFQAETSRGTATTMIAFLEQRPFIGDHFPGTDVFVNVQIDGDGHPSTPEQLDQLAATLVEHARQLRFLARRLAVLRETGR